MSTDIKTVCAYCAWHIEPDQECWLMATPVCEHCFLEAEQETQ